MFRNLILSIVGGNTLGLRKSGGSGGRPTEKGGRSCGLGWEPDPPLVPSSAAGAPRCRRDDRSCTPPSPGGCGRAC